MRKELEQIEKIDRFLNGELSDIESEAFQKEMEANLTLRKEVEKQHLLQEGIKTLELKGQAQKAFKTYKTVKFAKYFGIPSTIILTSAVVWNINKTEIDVTPVIPEKLDTTNIAPTQVQDTLQEKDANINDTPNVIKPEPVINIPDIIIEAEDYTDFNDATPENLGNEYRDEAVDIYLSGEALVVGHTFPNEWLEYSFDIDAAGEYEILTTIASGQDSVDRQMDLSINSSFYKEIKVPFTSSWLQYETIAIGKFSFSKGKAQKLRLDFKTGWINLDKITLRYLKK